MPRRWRRLWGAAALALLAAGAAPTWAAPFMLPAFQPLRGGQFASLLTLALPYATLMIWLMLPYALLVAAAWYGIASGRFTHGAWVAVAAMCAVVSSLGGYAMVATVAAPHRATGGALLLAVLPVLQCAAAAAVGGVLLLLFFGLRFALQRVGR